MLLHTNHQEKQLCLCDTWYLLFCVDDWYVGAYAPAYQSSEETTVYATLGTCYSV